MVIMCLSVLHNYFDGPIKLFSDLLNFQILPQNHSFRTELLYLALGGTNRANLQRNS